MIVRREDGAGGKFMMEFLKLIFGLM